MKKHLRIKKATKKSPGVKKYFSIPVISIFTVSVIGIFLLFITGSFSPNKGNQSLNSLVADYGGVENLLGQNGEWKPITNSVYFNNKIVLPPLPIAYMPDLRVLSAQSGDNKWIDISLGEQKLRAYEGDRLIYEFPVSTGLPWTPTVKGVFNVWYKIKYTRMVGGSVEAGNFYDLPNVPFNMFFHTDYAMHGAYWHNNFGHQMSHGCVNMRIPDAEQLFYWTTPVLAAEKTYTRSTVANPGTKVVVHD